MTTLHPIRQRTVPPTAAQARHAARRASLRCSATRAKTADDVGDGAVATDGAALDMLWDTLLEDDAPLAPALCWSTDSDDVALDRLWDALLGNDDAPLSPAPCWSADADDAAADATTGGAACDAAVEVSVDDAAAAADTSIDTTVLTHRDDGRCGACPGTELPLALLAALSLSEEDLLGDDVLCDILVRPSPGAAAPDGEGRGPLEPPAQNAPADAEDGGGYGDWLANLWRQFSPDGGTARAAAAPVAEWKGARAKDSSFAVDPLSARTESLDSQATERTSNHAPVSDARLAPDQATAVADPPRLRLPPRFFDLD